MSRSSNNKYENAILYLCKAQGGKLYGKKKLAKLLYYVDFDRYEYKESGETVTGDTYKAWKMGPVPTQFAKLLQGLESSGAIEIESTEQPIGYLPAETYICKREPDMSVFDEDDIKILERVSKMYGRLTGKQLEELTHAEAPYVGTEPDQEIAFDLAYYRGTDFGRDN